MIGAMHFPGTTYGYNRNDNGDKGVVKENLLTRLRYFFNMAFPPEWLPPLAARGEALIDEHKTVTADILLSLCAEVQKGATVQAAVAQFDLDDTVRSAVSGWLEELFAQRR